MIVKKSKEFLLNVEKGVKFQILSNDDENLVVVHYLEKPVVTFDANDSRLKALVEFINNHLK